MQWNDVASNWTAFIPRIMTKWPEADEAEVQSIGGDRDRFVDYIAKLHGTDRQSAEIRVGEFLEGQAPVDAMMDQSRDNQRIMASADNVPAGEDVYSDDRKFGDDDTTERPMGKTTD